jgi:hypothetical protein
MIYDHTDHKRQPETFYHKRDFTRKHQKTLKKIKKKYFKCLENLETSRLMLEVFFFFKIQNFQ